MTKFQFLNLDFILSFLILWGMKHVGQIFLRGHFSQILKTEENVQCLGHPHELVRETAKGSAVVAS